jgi:prepilin-type N-terminal cleavage/methylation domain-containing protein
MKLSPSVRSLRRGFSLVEMLVVIVILGILAALSVPAIKNLGKSNVQVSASRQLLDDLARARQLAISQRTTVYMVFVPANFWTGMNLTKLTPTQLSIVTNLVERQLSGYALVSYGRVGDQPGQHQWNYLSDWQALPEGSFIALWKFVNPSQPLPFQFSIPNSIGLDNSISAYAFDFTNSIPFPTADASSLAIWPLLPYIAFNYRGALVSNSSDRDRAGTGVIIPLAQGNVNYGYDGQTKSPTLTPITVADIQENPPGNSTNISYNVIDVDALTGRATQQQFKMQ